MRWWYFDDSWEGLGWFWNRVVPRFQLRKSFEPLADALLVNILHFPHSKKPLGKIISIVSLFWNHCLVSLPTELMPYTLKELLLYSLCIGADFKGVAWSVDFIFLQGRF
jgi:hypothetical protein